MDPRDFIQAGFLRPEDLHKAAPEEPAGQRLGRYELRRMIGQGGSSTVHHARDLLLNRDVALKRLRPEGGPAVARFLREAELLAKLSHPAIVPIFDLGRDGESVYFTMPLIEGETLMQRIGAGRIEPREAARIIRDASDAVRHAHDSGIVHRDLKPSNIMIDLQGRVLVTDFGLGRMEGGGEKRETATGAFMGTLYYMPPEQARGDWERVGPWSDVYSMGATLYETLTGRPPLEGDSALDILRKISQDEPRSPRRIDPSIPWELEVICLKALEKEPGRRYPTMKEFAEDLGRYLRGEPVLARPAGPVYRIRKRLGRHRLAIAASATALVVTATVLAPGWWRAAEAERQRARLADMVRDLIDPVIASYERDQFDKPHDLSRSREELLRLEARIRELLGSLPEARIQTGRIRRHLRDLPGALAELDAGLAALGDRARGRDFLERAIVRFATWQEEFGAGLSPIDPASAGSQEEARRRLAPIRDDLAEVARLGLGAQSKGWERYAAAALHFAEGRTDQGRQILSDLVAESGVDGLLAAESWKLMAKGSFLKVDSARAARDYAEACDIKRSDPEAWVGAAQARHQRCWFELGGDPVAARAEMAGALEDAERAVMIDREYATAWYAKGRLLRDLAQGNGRESGLLEARRAADEAIRIRPGYREAITFRAAVALALADLESARGGDPTPWFDAAQADHTRLIEADPRNARAFHNRSGVHVARARWRHVRGDPAAEDFDRAYADCSRAVEIDPDFSDAHFTRGCSRIDKTHHLEVRGSAISDVELAGAIRDLSRAIELRPPNPAALAYRGTAHRYRKAWSLAFKDLQEAIRLHPPLSSTFGPLLEEARLRMADEH